MPAADLRRKASGTTQQLLQQVSHHENGCTGGQKLGTMTPFDVAAHFASQPQSPTPYQQEEQDVFEIDPRQPGTVPDSKIKLLPSFKAGAAKSNMIWAFTRAVEKISSGQV